MNTALPTVGPGIRLQGTRGYASPARNDALGQRALPMKTARCDLTKCNHIGDGRQSKDLGQRALPMKPMCSPGLKESTLETVGGRKSRIDDIAPL